MAKMRTALEEKKGYIESDSVLESMHFRAQGYGDD